MMELVAFALSAALAQVLTNLDNLAALLALMLTVGTSRAVAGYVLAQAIVLATATAVAFELNATIPGWTGFFGLVPITLGLRGVWSQFRGSTGEDLQRVSSGASVIVTTLLFLSLSMDSFAVMAPLLADSTADFRVAALMGAATAVAGLGALALISATWASSRWVHRLERLGPYAMILAGLYVLSNTPTDVV